MKQYFYNERTHRLHIKGYCKESKMLPYHVLEQFLRSITSM